MSFAPNICIFCGKPGTSKQHIFPNRLKRIIPRTQSAHIRTRFGVNENAQIHKSQKTNQGHSGTVTCKKVCNNCNTKWMRLVEEKAYGILSNLALNQETIISGTDLVSLTAFLANFFAVVDQDDKNYAAVSQAERTYIFENQKPPPNWRFFVARVASTHTLWFRHHGLKVGTMTDGIFLPCDYVNVQICTSIFGNLLVHVISAPNNILDLLLPEGEMSYAKVMRILPLNDFVNLLDVPILTSQDVYVVADLLLQFTLNTGSPPPS